MLARLGQQSALGTYWKDRIKRYKIDIVKQFFLIIYSFEISASRLIKELSNTKNYIPGIFTSGKLHIKLVLGFCITCPSTPSPHYRLDVVLTQQQVSIKILFAS